MKFEWDPKKARSNIRKHKVTFEEAACYEAVREYEICKFSIACRGLIYQTRLRSIPHL
jgi:hypothetical protein